MVTYAPLGHQAPATMTQFSTQLHYTDTELTSPYHILDMLSIRLGSNKYQFCKSLHWLAQDLNPDESTYHMGDR